MRSTNSRGFTLMEIMIVVAIIFVILSVAVPNVMDARRHANEVTVIRMIGTIHTAQAQYQSQTGNFAVSLPELARHMSPKLAAGNHSGYNFVLEGTPEGYLLTATPEKAARGGRAFTSDQTLIVRDPDGNDVAR